MTQNDAVAGGLAALVLLGLALWPRTTVGAPGGGNTGPGPGPADAALEAARSAIQNAKIIAGGLTNEQRESLAHQLEQAASSTSNAQAAEELRAAAADLRAMNVPVEPGPGPNPPAPQPSLLDQFNLLRRRAEDYLRGAGVMDAVTLDEMDRVAAALASANPPMPATAAALVTLTNASRAKSGIRRPIAVAL